MWWKANLFYFILGSLVYDLYCPLRFVKQLPTTEDTTGMLYWMGLVALRNLSIVVSELEPPVSSCFPRLLIAFLCHIAVWYGGWHHQLYTLKKLPVKEKFLAEPSYTHGYLLDQGHPPVLPGFPGRIGRGRVGRAPLGGPAGLRQQCPARLSVGGALIRPVGGCFWYRGLQLVE